MVAANPGIVAFRCGLALIHAEAGELELAREHLAVLAADGFAAVPRDASWTTSLLGLSEVAAEIGDVQAAATLAGFLEPYAGRLLLATKGLACLGSADRLLGRLAATLGRWEEAESRFQAAERLERGVGSRLLLARTHDSRSRALGAGGLSPDSPARCAPG